MHGKFQSTLPSQGATLSAPAMLYSGCDFNPRSPHRERLRVLLNTVKIHRFQSTLPSQGATIGRCPCCGDILISIHAPLTGSDIALSWYSIGIKLFQSTLPSQGATVTLYVPARLLLFQSTLPSQGATEISSTVSPSAILFQSTLPSQGATGDAAGGTCKVQDFNPRSPHRERPGAVCRQRLFSGISIHAPLTGSDVMNTPVRNAPAYFNPRSPHRERQQICT